MATSNVISLNGNTKPRHPDRTLLGYTANWHVAVAGAKLAWAKSERQDLYGTTHDTIVVDVPYDQLDQIAEAEEFLAIWKPKTTLGAYALLGVAFAILQAREDDPEARIGQGPVLEIIRNLRSAMARDDIALCRHDAEVEQ